MGNVVYLQEHRREQVRQVGLTGSYYCIACNRDFFKILENGLVQCYSCGKQISNLKAVMK